MHFSINFTIHVTEQDRVGPRNVVDDKSFALCPRVLRSIPGSPSMFRIRLKTMAPSSEMLLYQNH